MKSVQMRKFFWSVFSYIWTEYGDLRNKSPYSARIQENMDQKKLHIWTLFTHSKFSLDPSKKKILPGKAWMVQVKNKDCYGILIKVNFSTSLQQNGILVGNVTF